MAEREARIGEIADVARAIRMAADEQGTGLGRTIFFIGAGCSKSAGVPLASDIARQIVPRLAKRMEAPESTIESADASYRWLAMKRHISDCCEGTSPLRIDQSDSQSDSRPIEWPRVYDTLFTDHYTEPNEVREIFSDLIDKTKGRINWAHLCLGELVKRRLVSTVITTNFDQLVLAGMVRAGVLPAVCDGIEALSRIRGAPLHAQLIELHGSRHTYRLRNSRRELAEVGNARSAVTAIGSIFQSLSTFVVVGYGGREDVMDQLIDAAERFSNKRLIWVAHDKDPSRLSPKAKHLLATSDTAWLLPGQDADSFFLRLLKELNVGAPESMREPLYLANLHASLLVSHDSNEIADRAIIMNEIKRHRGEIAALRHALDRHRKDRTVAETAIVQARELQLAGKLSDALQILRTASKRSKDRELWQQLAEIAYEFGQHNPDRDALETAVAAWRRVLARTDRKQDPIEWARTQHGLGVVLRGLGERESGTARFQESVAAFHEALKERTRKREPLEWAATQNDLGYALFRLGERESGAAQLEEAVVAFRASLEEITRERAPLQWATTQNNLGNALMRLGEHESKTGRLEQAIAAYRAALLERTRERVPLDWAMTQNNLGAVHQILGARASGAAQLEQGVAAYRAALQERSRKSVPLEWSSTHYNLGITLSILGEREQDIVRLDEAIMSFRDALKERTRERVPLDWAATHFHLGATLVILGKLKHDSGILEQAITSLRLALDFYETEKLRFVSSTRNKLLEAETLIAKLRIDKQ